MIMRRLAQSLRDQNWTAIAIEFVLLVLGVFLGLQVANWNEDRLDAKRGAELTERLKEDLDVEAWNYQNMIGYHGQVRANALRAADALAGRTELSDEALLVAAYRATQYSDNTRARSTYDELTSTGDFGLIADPALRNLSNHLYNTPVFQWFTDEGRNSRFRRWFRMHIPHPVQAAVAEACGDKVVNTHDYAGIPGVLDYACQVPLPAADIAAAAAILRSDPDALAALRLRIADLGTSLANLDTFYADEWTYLRTVSAEEAR
jgi:hypothetical protein